MSREIVGVISARMGSTRLSGKVMMPILGRPMLELLIERVKRSKLLDQIIVATTTNKTDDCVYELAKKMRVGVFRGSERDVLGRVIEAGKKYGADIVVRLTGDNPLIDPKYIDKGIKIFLSGDYDYVANDNIELTMPRGFDVEVVTLTGLKQVQRKTNNPWIHEHVTLYFYKNPNKFKLKAFGPDKENLKFAKWHLAVDAEEDLKLVGRIFETLYPQNPCFTYEDVVSLLEESIPEKRF